MSTKKPTSKKIKMLCTQGSKGGVGKTFFAAQLAAWLREQGHPFVALDLDTENINRSGLKHYLPEAEKVNIHTIQTLDVLIESSQMADVVLVDMPAATGYLLFEWFNKMHKSCEELGIEFVFFCMITSAPGTVENMLEWASALQDKVTYVAVKNPMTDEKAKFEMWEKATEVQEFKKHLTCHEILLPSIREDIAPHLELEGLTIDQAISTAARADGPPTVLSKLTVQIHLGRWKEAIYGQLNDLAAKGVLIP